MLLLSDVLELLVPQVELLHFISKERTITLEGVSRSLNLQQFIRADLLLDFQSHCDDSIHIKVVSMRS